MQQEKNNTSNLLIAAAIGAGSMYLFDPAYGKRRRAFVRDKAIRFLHAIENGSGVIARDLTNRTWGLGVSVTRVFRHKSADDPVLEARVRSEMGRWVSHPHAIHVEASNGCITLSGDILQSEKGGFLTHINRVPGVQGVENRLRGHQSNENFPGLQGGERRESRFELLQTNWAPGPRLLAGAAGALMIGNGIRTRAILGLGMSIAGALLVIRAITNRELTQFLGKQESEKEQVRPEIPPRPTTPEPPEYRVH